MLVVCEQQHVCQTTDARQAESDLIFEQCSMALLKSRSDINRLVVGVLVLQRCPDQLLQFSAAELREQEAYKVIFDSRRSFDSSDNNRR